MDEINYKSRSSNRINILVVAARKELRYILNTCFVPTEIFTNRRNPQNGVHSSTVSGNRAILVPDLSGMPATAYGSCLVHCLMFGDILGHLIQTLKQSPG